MTCINNSNSEKTEYLTNMELSSNCKIYNIPKGKVKNPNDIKLFLYKRNFEIYNDIISNNYPNTYKNKLKNEINKYHNNVTSEINYKNVSSNIYEEKDKKKTVENENSYGNFQKNSKEKLDKKKISLSGEIYEEESSPNKKNKKKIIKGKYVEKIPEKKDYIRAKLVKLNYESKKILTNDKYDFYGENCSFLIKDDEDNEEQIYNEKELVSQAKKKNDYIFKNGSNSILFLNTSFFKKKMNNIQECENLSTLKVDEMDINKIENKSWKQNMYQKQLETLNETTDKTKFHGYRRAESLENIEKNEIKNKEILSFNDELFEDEKITIFKDINNELLNDEIIAVDSNDNVEVKNRKIKDNFGTDGENIEEKTKEISYSNEFNNESISSIPNKEYSSKRPSISHHLYHYKQSKEIFNVTNIPVDRRSISLISNVKKDEIKRKNNNIKSETFDNNNNNDDDDIEHNYIDEFLENVDLNKNLLKDKRISMRNCSEDCLDKMLMNYLIINNKKNIRFNLNDNATEDLKKIESSSQSNLQTPETSTLRRQSKVKPPKISKKNSSSSITTVDASNDSKKTSRKNSNSSNNGSNNNNSSSLENTGKKRSNSSINNVIEKKEENSTKNNNSLAYKKKRRRDFPIAEPKKGWVIDLDLIRPIKQKNILDLIEKNNNIPFDEKICLFKAFQSKITFLMKEIKLAKEKKEKEEAKENQKKKDLELIDLLKAVYENHQSEALAALQEQENAKKGGKKMKRIPSSDEKDKKQSTTQPSQAANVAKSDLSANSTFHINSAATNNKNQAHSISSPSANTSSNPNPLSSKAKKSNENINNSKGYDSDEMETVKEKYSPEEFKKKLDDIKEKLKLDEKNLKVIKFYDTNLKENLKEKIKNNILRYEVKNIKKYYKKKDHVNLYNMSSKNVYRIEKKPLKSISQAGSLMDIKTYNKIDTSILNSFYNYENSRNIINNEDNEDSTNRKSTTNCCGLNEHKLLQTDLYRMFKNSQPSKFKNPEEQVKTVSDVTLPTIADYKNKLYYHNNRYIDINKRDNNISCVNSKAVYYNGCRKKSLKSKNSNILTFKSNSSQS